jgi:hypothetical protein
VQLAKAPTVAKRTGWSLAASFCLPETTGALSSVPYIMPLLLKVNGAQLRVRSLMIDF